MKLLTTKEVAEYLQLDRRTVTNMAQRGELPATKIGGKWRFRKSEIDAYLRARGKHRSEHEEISGHEPQ